MRLVHAQKNDVSWQAQRFRLPPALRGQPVGFKEIADDEWELHYGPLLIGYVLMRDGKLHVEHV
ncbi:MAG TPA: hypothetical protein VGH28_02320 [Polyangiaceae bacterium]